MGEGHKIVSDPKLYILLLSLSSAVLVVTLYHCIIICCCDRNPAQQQRRRRLRPQTTQEGEPSMKGSSFAQLIPARKYQKGVGLVLVGDGMCAICINEYEEGEEFRTLPECMHSFHVPCIDMWLYSHPSCPICRSDATPSTLKPQNLLDFGSGELERSPEQRILQEIVVMQP